MSVNANDVAAAVLAHVGPVEAMRLQKLVYYSQSWHLALLDEPLFRDTIQAWRDGPVTPTLWEQHRGGRMVGRWSAGDVTRLPETSAKIVELVCHVYGSLSGDDLSELTHSEEPWRKAREGVADDQPSKAVISTDAMKQFYRRRTLAGLRAADLVSGGLHGFLDHSIDAAERRELLAGIRDEFRSAEPGATGKPDPISSGSVVRLIQPGDSPTQTRLNRERPHRGSAAHQI
ncbi:Panacea domain-containing protein [Actinoplanes sp. N902-109]|uniref:Panacea domain-containing protein n=1 Tax=Actinoplanes sp. (strain N902-109) TaxID=649831 RepID=UPI00032939BC|nr:type II toxin-antitoxin system antitoxin SocA domain-containing protein [Actinoplanes sp. N902-109]AGL20022.1 putative phage-associated protein-like protein [Actinoplanes sp. N902-109]